MKELYPHIAIMLLPLALTNVLHMVIVKYNFPDILTHPVHRRLFGENKTWRGMFLIPVLNALFMIPVSLVLGIQIVHPLLLGFLLGLAYVLSELPNSYLKRRLGIGPGERSGRFSVFQFFSDKIDSALGVNVLYALIMKLDLTAFLLLFLASVLIHILISGILVLLGIKAAF